MRLYVKDTFDFKRLMHEKKVTGKQLSEELPINYIYFSNVLNGHRSIGNEKASAIARYFDKEITDLFEFKEVREGTK